MVLVPLLFDRAALLAAAIVFTGTLGYPALVGVGLRGIARAQVQTHPHPFAYRAVRLHLS